MCLNGLPLNSECFDSLIQATLVPCGLVLGDNTLVDHAVDHRYGILVGGRCSVLIAGIACLDDALDLGAHKRTHAHVVLASLLTLAGAFSC